MIVNVSYKITSIQVYIYKWNGTSPQQFTGLIISTNSQFNLQRWIHWWSYEFIGVTYFANIFSKTRWLQIETNTPSCPNAETTFYKHTSKESQSSPLIWYYFYPIRGTPIYSYIIINHFGCWVKRRDNIRQIEHLQMG